MTTPRPAVLQGLHAASWVVVLAALLPVLASLPGLLRLPSMMAAPAPLLTTMLGPGLAGLVWFGAVGLLGRAAWTLIHSRREAVAEGVPGLWRRLHSRPKSALGLAGVAALALCSGLAPLLAPHDPLALHAVPSLTPPSLECWLGSDLHGRDLLSRFLWGGRVSLAIGLLSVGMSVGLGCSLGAVAGWHGGRLGRLIMGAADLFLALPRLVLVLAVLGILRLSGPASLLAVVLVLGATGWMTMARMVRASVRSMAEGPVARAGLALGLPTARILARHLLPQVMGPVLVHATLNLGRVVLIEASLSFLGLGVPQPTPSWGATIAIGREWLHSAWWIRTFPGLALVGLVVGLELLAEGWRER